MSGGPVCSCEESKKPMNKRAWRITQRHCNHSAFNGYHKTWSDWSGVTCTRCSAHWRTKANYVLELNDVR